MHCAGHWWNVLGTLQSRCPKVKRNACAADFQKALGILRELYQSGVSESLQYRIEVTAASFGPKSYAMFLSKCGPVISILKLPANIEMYGKGDSPRLMLEYDFHQIEEGTFTPFLVIENAETGERIVAKWKQEPFGPGPVSGGGSVGVEIPVGTKSGKYRVYCQFEQAGKVVSAGHAFETVWPHGAGYQDRRTGK